MVIRRQENPPRFAALHVPPYGCRQHPRNDRIALVRVNDTLDGQMPFGPHTAHAEPSAGAQRPPAWELSVVLLISFPSWLSGGRGSACRSVEGCDGFKTFLPHLGGSAERLIPVGVCAVVDALLEVDAIEHALRISEFHVLAVALAPTEQAGRANRREP